MIWNKAVVGGRLVKLNKPGRRVAKINVDEEPRVFILPKIGKPVGCVAEIDLRDTVNLAMHDELKGSFLLCGLVSMGSCVGIVGPNKLVIGAGFIGADSTKTAVSPWRCRLLRRETSSTIVTPAVIVKSWRFAAC